MTDNKYDVSDLIISAVEQKPLDFENAFNDLIVSRLQNSIENRKLEIAQQMYGYNSEEENVEDLDAGSEELESSEEE